MAYSIDQRIGYIVSRIDSDFVHSFSSNLLIEDLVHLSIPEKFTYYLSKTWMELFSEKKVKENIDNLFLFIKDSNINNSHFMKAFDFFYFKLTENGASNNELKKLAAFMRVLFLSKIGWNKQALSASATSYIRNNTTSFKHIFSNEEQDLIFSAISSGGDSNEKILLMQRSIFAGTDDWLIPAASAGVLGQADYFGYGENILNDTFDKILEKINIILTAKIPVGKKINILNPVFSFYPYNNEIAIGGSPYHSITQNFSKKAADFIKTLVLDPRYSEILKKYLSSKKKDDILVSHMLLNPLIMSNMNTVPFLPKSLSASLKVSVRNVLGIKNPTNSSVLRDDLLFLNDLITEEYFSKVLSTEYTYGFRNMFNFSKTTKFDSSKLQFFFTLYYIYTELLRKDWKKINIDLLHGRNLEIFEREEKEYHGNYDSEIFAQFGLPRDRTSGSSKTALIRRFFPKEDDQKLFAFIRM